MPNSKELLAVKTFRFLLSLSLFSAAARARRTHHLQISVTWVPSARATGEVCEKPWVTKLSRVGGLIIRAENRLGEARRPADALACDEERCERRGRRPG